MPDPASKTSKEEALRRLSEAAAPYGLRVVKTHYSNCRSSFSSDLLPTDVRWPGTGTSSPRAGSHTCGLCFRTRSRLRSKGRSNVSCRSGWRLLSSRSSRSLCGYRWLTGNE